MVSVWAVAYFLWPRFTFDDGPFFLEPFSGDFGGLSPLSSKDVTLFGATFFVLELAQHQIFIREPSSC